MAEKRPDYDSKQKKIKPDNPSLNDKKTYKEDVEGISFAQPSDAREKTFKPKVHWLNEENDIVINENWLRNEISPYIQEADVTFTRGDYEASKEDLRLELLADSRKRACLRTKGGKRSTESKFKQLETLTIGRFKRAIRQKARYKNIKQSKINNDFNESKKRESDYSRKVVECETKNGPHTKERLTEYPGSFHCNVCGFTMPKTKNN